MTVETLDLQQVAAQAGRDLEGASAGDVVAWTVDTFGDGFCVASSMKDAVLVDLVSRVRPGAAVVFVDTGYHFDETLLTRDAIAATYPVRVLNVTPRHTVADQDRALGARLYERDPDLCCRLRKVAPLEQALKPYAAWVSGIRREEAPTRQHVPVVQWDADREIVKVNPLVAWTRADLERYIAEHDVFVNPLVPAGYPSIGCAPCTRAVRPGESERAGRWAGTAKNECGLHS